MVQDISDYRQQKSYHLINCTCADNTVSANAANTQHTEH